MIILVRMVETGHRDSLTNFYEKKITGTGPSDSEIILLDNDLAD